MKKILIILCMTALVTVTGLTAQENWYISYHEDGKKAANNKVTLQAGERFVYVYFSGPWAPLKADFDKMKIDFEISAPVEVSWQCAYYQAMAGGVLGSGELIGIVDKGPVETNFASFTQQWGGKVFFGSDKDAKERMNGICLRVVVPPKTSVTFIMKSVEFTGLRSKAAQ